MEHSKYLIEAGHDSKHVRSVFCEVGNLSRNDVIKTKYKTRERSWTSYCKFRPRAPYISKILSIHQGIIETLLLILKSD